MICLAHANARSCALLLLAATGCLGPVGSGDTEGTSAGQTTGPGSVAPTTPHDSVPSFTNNLQPPAPTDDGNRIADYVKQCESVLGPVPEINCDPQYPAPGTRVTKIPVFLEGLLLGFDDDLSIEEQTILAQRELDEDYTCDFATLGGDFPCSVGSTLVQYESPDNPNVQWLGLCRGVQRDNPRYDRFIGNGLIGANIQTGEMCFFFGTNSDPEGTYELPPLSGTSASNDELSPWRPPRQMPGSCISCHANNDPWILTPWLMPDYMHDVLTDPSYPLRLPEDVQLEDVMAARYVRSTPVELKRMLPEAPADGRIAWTEEEIFGTDARLKRRQYRILGSSYVDVEAEGSVMARTGDKPDSWYTNFRERLLLQPLEVSCASSCHATGNANFEKLARDALGDKYSRFVSATGRNPNVRGFHWMDPNQLIDPESVDLETYTTPAITHCPIPKQIERAPSMRVHCAAGEASETYVDLSWDYVNDYGGVPNRNDVRFDVAYGAVQSMPHEFGASTANPLVGEPMVADGAIEVLADLAATSDSHYRVRVSVPAGETSVEIRLQPKRYCFEETTRHPFSYSAPYVVQVDLASTCP